MSDVIVIVDPEFGDRLEEVARISPIWMVDTKKNRAAFEPLWKSDPHQDHREPGAITSCKITDPEERLGNLLGILPAVRTDPGEISDDGFAFLPGFVLEAIGLRVSDEAKLGLQGFGLTSFIDTAHGFRASVSTSYPTNFES